MYFKIVLHLPNFTSILRYFGPTVGRLHSFLKLGHSSVGRMHNFIKVVHLTCLKFVCNRNIDPYGSTVHNVLVTICSSCVGRINMYMYIRPTVVGPKYRRERKCCRTKVILPILKEVFATNERGYRLSAIKKRFWSLLILLLSVASIRRKLLKTSHTE